MQIDLEPKIGKIAGRLLRAYAIAGLMLLLFGPLPPEEPLSGPPPEGRESAGNNERMDPLCRIQIVDELNPYAFIEYPNLISYR